MVKKDTKTIYVCENCGYTTAKWLGKCPECGQWDVFIEEAGSARKKKAPTSVLPSPTPIDAIEIDHEERLTTAVGEFDRVLGGGVVPGSLILVGGDPGIGKSTLMLQILFSMSQNGYRTLYVSGEESVRQIKLRSQRLGTIASQLYVVSETDVDAILGMIENLKPEIVVVDSIQTMYTADLTSAPGSVSQVRESAMKLMLMSKNEGIPIFIVGHVTKEGVIAGPRLLEHMVDTVLYFEGDKNHIFRILRAVKNRFGSTNEIGVFEMKENGLEEVENPSAVFLSERPCNASGSVVTASMEGARPILVELQALAGSTSFGTPRRTILGLDPHRVSLIVAVMEKKIGIHLMTHDIYMNVAGGVKVMEPAVDLAVISAIASSFLDQAVPDDCIILGEVGLTGEVRAISHPEQRIYEAKKMGFSTCFIPNSNFKRIRSIENMEIVGVDTAPQVMERLFQRLG